MVFLQLDTDVGSVWVSAHAILAVSPREGGSTVWVQGHAFDVLADPNRILKLLGAAYRRLYDVDDLDGYLDDDEGPTIDLRDEDE